MISLGSAEIPPDVEVSSSGSRGWSLLKGILESPPFLGHGHTSIFCACNIQVNKPNKNMKKFRITVSFYNKGIKTGAAVPPEKYIAAPIPTTPIPIPMGTK